MNIQVEAAIEDLRAAVVFDDVETVEGAAEVDAVEDRFA